MDSLRDVACRRLTPEEKVELLRLGAAARLADDDFVWVMLAASIRLDMDRFTRIAEIQARARIEEETARLVDRAAERISDLTRYAVQGARWERPSHRLALIAMTSLILLTTLVGAFLVAERGWVGYLNAKISELKAKRDELARNPPPAWLSWAKDGANKDVAFLSLPSARIELQPCNYRREQGTCVYEK